MPTPSLADMARRTLVKNITNLTDIGDVPYHMVRSILLKIENPNQLQKLEEACPHLYGADDELWINFIKRDIPNAGEKMLYPKNPKSWWKVYRKMLQDHQREVEADAAKLKAAYNSIKAVKMQHQSRVMEGVPHIPKLDGMQFAHAAEYNRVKKPKIKRDTRPLRTTARFGAQTGKMLTGRGVMDKVRREAMERIQRDRVMSTPTHQLSGFASPVLVAPRHMVEQYQKPSPPKPLDPTIPKPAKFEPPRRKVESQPRTAATTREEGEDRLRAITNPGNAAKAARPANSTAISTEAATTNSLTASSPSLIRKPASYTIRPQILTPSTSLSTGLQHKAEDLPTAPCLEATDVRSSGSPNSITGSPRRINVPRLKTASPESLTPRLQKKKAPVDIFIPAKKRRLL
ncbi:MAG: hypothetical protein Q9182_000048 [Xanthomendoza sp. 2 TL-2023]